MISNVLTYGWPDCHWSLFGEDYNSLVWSESNSLPKPTLLEIQSKENELSLINDKLNTFNSAIAAGFTVPNETFTLRLTETDRAAFAQMLALVREALDLGMIDNDTIQTISDINSELHQVSILKFRQIMVSYGFYYKTLWDALVS